MSFSISINAGGHSPEPHNAAVKAAFESVVRRLRSLPGATVSATGYSYDDSGKVELHAEEVIDE